MENILQEIREERKRQDAKWGVQNHPILNHKYIDWKGSEMCEHYKIPSEEEARRTVDRKVKSGELTYMDILIEEIAEVAESKNPAPCRVELIQSAAVIVAMIESLDRNNI
nr:hypothetical protein BACY1_20660 [Tenacibaculum mesophilum]